MAQNGGEKKSQVGMGGANAKHTKMLISFNYM